MAQLDLGPETDIARQQAEHRRFAQGQALLDKSRNPLANVALALPQDLIEPENITRKEPLEVFRRARDTMKPEELPHQADIRSSGKFKFFEAIRSVEFRSEYLGEGAHPRAAGANQRAINVEQDQPNHESVKRKPEAFATFATF